MPLLPRIRLRTAGGEADWWERRKRYAQGIRPGRLCWVWRSAGVLYYRPVTRYPRRSEITAGLTRWSEVWKAQEGIIDTIARPDDRRAFQEAVSLAIARVEVVAEVYAAPHLIARTPARHESAQWLLAALADLEERARMPGLRLDGERWLAIDWPQWHADWAERLLTPPHWSFKEKYEGR